jgi:uncharacterized protein DUF4446
MTEFWAVNGFYLWALTTALVIIALAWLAWNTFGPAAEESNVNVGSEADSSALETLAARIEVVNEALPHMQATLGRTLQRYGLVRHADATGQQAFTLALANARGDGMVLASSVRGGLTAKSLVGWASGQALTKEEQEAIERARNGSES